MQNKVKDFNYMVKKYHKKTMDISARLLDIQSEIGEVGKEYLKITKYGTKPFVKNTEFEMEIGDALYSLLSLCEETNCSAENCLNMALEKYKSRLSAKKNMGSK